VSQHLANELYKEVGVWQLFLAVVRVDYFVEHDEVLEQLLFLFLRQGNGFDKVLVESVLGGINSLEVFESVEG
jgi:hypothetical protein